MGSGNTAKSTWGSRAARSILTLAAAAAVAAPAFADVTHVTVRFRDAASGTSAPGDVARLQRIAAALRTGIGEASVTHDGAYRLALSPALADGAAHAALGRLRVDDDVLYADAFEPATVAVRPKRDENAPLVSRIIVKFRAPQVAADAAANLPLSADRVAQLTQRAGRALAPERTMSWASAHVVALLQAVSEDEAEAIAAAIAQDPDVEWAQADYRLFPQLVPNDPQYASQWHYFAPTAPNIGAANLPGAWDRTVGWSGVRTAVIDTGSLFGHPDLAGRFIGGYDFISDWIFANDGDPPQPPDCGPQQNPRQAPCLSSRDADAADPGDWITSSENAGTSLGGWLLFCGTRNSSWHGTHVAGTVGAATNNGVGVAGVNWVSRIVPVRALGKCGGSLSDIADGIVWASGGSVAGVPANPHPARVLNLSLGGGGTCTSSPLMQSAITDALSRNSAVIVAAGNQNSNAANYTPASCNGVVTVAAVGRAGQRASYSNFGTAVEIAAPGGSSADGEATILSTLNSGTTTPNPGGMNYASYQGTSMATPHVAGIVSLMLSLKPSLTPGQVTTLLQSTARAFPAGTLRDCSVATCGAGIVNADALLTSILTTGGPGGAALLPSAALVATLPNPSNAGAAVTINASVAGTAPTGTVTITDGDSPVPGCVDLPLTGTGNTRAAQCVTAALGAGARSLRAVYSGNSTHVPADSPLHLHTVNVVSPQPSVTTLSSNLNPAAQGASVTLLARVSGIAPTGNVAFRANGAGIGGCSAVALTGAGDTRTAQCVTTSLPAGSLALEAQYAGDAQNQSSTGTLTQGVFGAAACAPFNDVAASHAFCGSVQWLFNRAVTLGCLPGSYCPDASVTRLQMAAFMRRTGAALESDDAYVWHDLTISFGGGPVVCWHQSTKQNADFPRRARLRASINAFAPSTSTNVTAQYVYSTDGGVSWTNVPSASTTQTLLSGRSPADDKTSILTGELDMTDGLTYLFGVRVTTAPSASMSLYCVSTIRYVSRTSATAPF